MFRSLRTRLVLSHTLPILVFVPLLGLWLLYQLEHHFVLDSLARDLADEGQVIAELTRRNAQTWTDPAQAQTLLTQLQGHESDASLELLNGEARLLASPFPSDSNRIGDIIRAVVLDNALQGKVSWTIDAGVNGNARLIDVAVPVRDEMGQVIGIIRLFHRLTDVQDRLNALRQVVLITLAIGGAITVGFGWLLARSLALPLVRLQHFATTFTPDHKPEQLPESGPQEIVMLAAALNQMSNRLFELEKTRKLLLAGIVHELGRPLGSIKMAAQTIASSLDDPVLTQELAQGIDTQINSLRLRIDDLALLGEMELQGLLIERQALDINELVIEQCHQFMALAAQKRQTISLDIAPALPIIQADLHRLEQIVGNLLHNACKYTPEQGKIFVTTTAQNQQVAICISDNGPGIAPSEQTRIFELFYRNPAQRKIHQGMGIGLALARQLAEAHGGTLSVTSKPGAGATFCLYLPLAPSP